MNYKYFYLEKNGQDLVEKKTKIWTNQHRFLFKYLQKNITQQRLKFNKESEIYT